MKLLTPAEVKSANEGAIAKTAIRTEATRKELATTETRLNEAEARFDATLANQRVVWAKEQEEKMANIVSLRMEIDRLTRERDQLRIPIELEAKKAHDLYTEAEEALHKANQIRINNEEVSQLLQEKLDTLTERETNLEEREQKLSIKEKAVLAHQDTITKLSQELSIKLGMSN